MVKDSEAALHAVHHVLVALRARALELGEKSPMYRIIDTIRQSRFGSPTRGTIGPATS